MASSGCRDLDVVGAGRLGPGRRGAAGWHARPDWAAYVGYNLPLAHLLGERCWRPPVGGPEVFGTGPCRHRLIRPSVTSTGRRRRRPSWPKSRGERARALAGDRPSWAGAGDRHRRRRGERAVDGRTRGTGALLRLVAVCALRCRGCPARLNLGGGLCHVTLSLWYSGATVSARCWSRASWRAPRCRWPWTHRNCVGASVLPAAHQRSTIAPSRQVVTLLAGSKVVVGPNV